MALARPKPRLPGTRPNPLAVRKSQPDARKEAAGLRNQGGLVPPTVAAKKRALKMTLGRE